MNVVELRTQIQELLVDDVGTYALTGGVTTPAVIVLDSGDVLSDRTVTGLEVVIRRNPISDEGKATFDAVRAAKMWQVFLVQWGGNYTLEAAKDKLRRKFPNTRAVTVKVEKGSGVREQVSVKIPDVDEFDDWL
ncbi:MAG: hypothetical protein KME13_21610 [Myxacorys californica WJT36-NPBG1]|nr:hypothetical protein [Myxacorys californica WJT36-NPBG1]